MGAVVLKYGLREILGLIEPFARAQGYDRIELWTDSQIRNPVRIANSNLLHSVGSEEFEPALLERILQCAHKLGRATTIGEIRQNMGPQEQLFRAVAKLIWSTKLVADDPGRLIDNKLGVTALTLLKNNGQVK